MINNQQGFTLIELFVSFGVLAVLSMLAITSFAVIKENAYNTEQRQLFANARTSLEGRPDNIETIAGSYRRIWQAYNSDTWSRLQVPVVKDFAPGIPLIIPDHIDMYLYEAKCSVPTCLEQWIDSWNCETGNWLRYYGYRNGTQVIQETYSAVIDAAC